MNRRMIHMASLSILAMTTVAGTVIAQSSIEPPRNALRIAERSAQMKTTLAQAISVAERHTSGVVIGVRLSMSKEAFQNEANGMQEYGSEYDRRTGDRFNDGARYDRDADGMRRDRLQTDGTATERRLNMPTTQDPTNDADRDTTRDPKSDPTQNADRTTTRDLTKTPPTDATRDTARTPPRDATKEATKEGKDNWFDDMPGGVNDPDRDRTQDLNRDRTQDLNRDRTQDLNRDGTRGAMRGSDQTERSYDDSAMPLYAIVTCVIDRSRVRDVVIDMSEGSVVGMQSVNAARMDARDDYAQDTYAESSRFALVRASELMNATVRNAEGQRVGDIDELVLDPDSNRVIYGVLRRGGFLGLNESRFAVPAHELSVPRDGLVRLNLNNSDFEGHSGFDNNNWPTQADPEWSTGWNSSNERAPAAKRIVKATDLIGTDVKCSEGQKVGEITDLIVEPRSGRVVYAIVTGERGDLVVPMSVVRAEGDARVMKMTHAEVMALPTLDGRNDPDWSDARWNRRTHDAYNATMDLTSVTGDSDRR